MSGKTTKATTPFWAVHTDWDRITDATNIRVGDRVWPRFQHCSGGMKWTVPDSMGVKSQTPWRVMAIATPTDSSVASAFLLQDYTTSGETKGCRITALPEDLANLNQLVAFVFNESGRATAAAQFA